MCNHNQMRRTHVWSKEVGDVPISRSAGDGNKVPADEKAADGGDSDWSGDGKKVPADEKDSDSSSIKLCCFPSGGDKLVNQKCCIGLNVCGCWPIC